jgi:hypothetical protein
MIKRYFAYFIQYFLSELNIVLTSRVASLHLRINETTKKQRQKGPGYQKTPALLK